MVWSGECARLVQPQATAAAAVCAAVCLLKRHCSTAHSSLLQLCCAVLCLLIVISWHGPSYYLIEFWHGPVFMPWRNVLCHGLFVSLCRLLVQKGLMSLDELRRATEALPGGPGCFYFF
jgi:hypothetical protein